MKYTLKYANRFSRILAYESNLKNFPFYVFDGGNLELTKNTYKFTSLEGTVSQGVLEFIKTINKINQEEDTYEGNGFPFILEHIKQKFPDGSFKPEEYITLCSSLGRDMSEGANIWCIVFTLLNEQFT